MEDKDEIKNIWLFSEISFINTDQKDNKVYKICHDSEDYCLALTNDNKSLIILKEQGFIEKNENLIFQAKTNEDNIELINCIDKCENCNKFNKYYEMINKLNYKLWLTIPKANIDDKDLENSYEIKENQDIFRIGDMMFIFREFHRMGTTEKSNEYSNSHDNSNNSTNAIKVYKNKYYYSDDNILYDKRIYTMILKPNKENCCSICEQAYIKQNNPIIKLCQCEKYYHFECMRNKIKESKEPMIKIDENKDVSILYQIKMMKCGGCGEFIIPSFLIPEANRKNKLYELVKIDRNLDEKYIILESINYLNKDNEYIKYIFYVKLNEEITKISIGKLNEDNNNNTQIINIGVDLFPKQKILLVCDASNKYVGLKNISDKEDIYILKNKLLINSKENLINFQSGNLKIKSKLIDKKKELENSTKIDIREEAII